MKRRSFRLVSVLVMAILTACTTSPVEVAPPTQVPILPSETPGQTAGTPTGEAPTRIVPTATQLAPATPSPTSTLMPATSTSLPPTETATPTNTPIPATRTPVPTVEYNSESVSFTTEDGYQLSGNLYHSEGDIAVILAHMAGESDQRDWTPFAKEIAKRGFTALTFDFRCYGESECGGSEPGDVLLSMDVGAAMGFLREQGYQRLVCIGASMGGRGCVNVAFVEALEGLVVVSGTGSYHPDRQNLNEFISPDMPKLFIVSESDHVANRATEMIRLFENAPKPKQLETFPGQAHGTELFSSTHRRWFNQMLFDFLAGVREQ